MIAGPEEKNSRLGSNVNPLLVLPYEVHFGFGIEPKHFSDRLIRSYVHGIMRGRRILIDHFNELWFTQKALKMEVMQHYLCALLALMTPQKMLKRRMLYFYGINIFIHTIFTYAFILYVYFGPKFQKFILEISIHLMYLPEIKRKIQCEY